MRQYFFKNFGKSFGGNVFKNLIFGFSKKHLAHVWAASFFTPRDGKAKNNYQRKKNGGDITGR